MIIITIKATDLIEVYMKKAARIVCAVFAAIIVSCHFFVLAGVANGEAVVVFDTVSGMPGQEVEMNVHLTKNPGITGLRFLVTYDKNNLTLTSAEYTQLGGGGLTSVNTEGNPFVLLWNVSTYEFNETGVLARLKFKIHDDAKAAELPVKVSYSRGDCIDFDLKNLTMDITNGQVQVLYDGTNCTHSETEKQITHAATCHAFGKYKTVCKACGSTVSEGNEPQLAHSYGKFIVQQEPSFHSEGYMEKVCNVCNDTVRQSIPRLEHSGDESLLDSSSLSIDSSSAPDTEDTSPIVGTEITSTENPATGDETVVLIIVAVISALLIVILVIKKAKDKQKANPNKKHKT